MSTLFGKKKKKCTAPKRKRKRTGEEEAAADVDEMIIVDRALTDGATTNNNDDAITKEAHSSKEASGNSNIEGDDDDDEDDEVDFDSYRSFDQLGLAEPLVATCRKLGFRRPTPVQRRVVPFLVRQRNRKNGTGAQQQQQPVLALAATGTGKTAAYLLPILHHLSFDPSGIYAVVVLPTRELAKQVHQQVLALGSAYAVQSALVVGGLDSVRQSCQLDHANPHFVVATPGRLAALLRGPQPPDLCRVRYLVLDEADRLLAGQAKGDGSGGSGGSSNCGFERDVAELLLHCNRRQQHENHRRRDQHHCQTLLFSATFTASLKALEELAGAGGSSRLPLRKFIIRQDGEVADDDIDANRKKKAKKTKKEKKGKDDKVTECTAATIPKGAEEGSRDDAEDEEESDDSDDDEDAITAVGAKIPNGLQQEYIFMPDRVRDAYLLATVRTLLANGGRSDEDEKKGAKNQKKQQRHWGKGKEVVPEQTKASSEETGGDNNRDPEAFKAKSCIIFVSTCERAALVSGILEQVGVANVALHSLLSQHRRLAALAKFQSERVRVMVATDVASRGLDVPRTDLVINAELPRNPVNYVHRVGRTARAGRRGRAVSLVAECDVALAHAAERASGRELVRCDAVTDETAAAMLGPAAKAARLTKLKLADIGFDELLRTFRERKVRDRKERQQREKLLLQLRQQNESTATTTTRRVESSI